MPDTEVVDALAREYMKRSGMAGALAAFDKENPRTEASISSTKGIVRALGMAKQFEANKARPDPYKSVLELLCWELGSSAALPVAAKDPPKALPATALSVDVETAAQEFYERKRGSAGSSSNAASRSQHRSLRLGANGGSARVITQSPNSGSTPKREWGFDGAKPATTIQELSPSAFGRQGTGPAGTPAAPAVPAGDMPSWATPGDPNNVTMNSSNASKYCVGQRVEGLAGGAVCGWVVAVSLEQGAVEVATKPPAAARGLSPAVGKGYSSKQPVGTPAPRRAAAPIAGTPVPQRVAADDLLDEADDLIGDIIASVDAGGQEDEDDLYSFG